MPTLHMDVEVCRGTQQKIIQQQGQMVQVLGQVTNSVNSTVGSAWIGQSATEFQAQYDQLRGSLTTQLETLNQLANRLAQEIAQWEAAASKMG